MSITPAVIQILVPAGKEITGASAGISPHRVLIKIASMWEGIQAARDLR